MGKSAGTEKRRVVKVGSGISKASWTDCLTDRHRDSQTRSWEDWVPPNTWNVWNSWWYQSPGGLMPSGLSVSTAALREHCTDLPSAWQFTLPNSPLHETLCAGEIQKSPCDPGCRDAAKNQQCLKWGKGGTAHHCQPLHSRIFMSGFDGVSWWQGTNIRQQQESQWARFPLGGSRAQPALQGADPDLKRDLKLMEILLTSSEIRRITKGSHPEQRRHIGLALVALSDCSPPKTPFQNSGGLKRYGLLIWGCRAIPVR